MAGQIRSCEPVDVVLRVDGDQCRGRTAANVRDAALFYPVMMHSDVLSGEIHLKITVVHA